MSFENDQLTTLQFIDNLILIHNFERCDTIVVDIKSKSNDRIICKSILDNLVKNFPMTNHELLVYNKELLGEIIKPEIKIESTGKISFKVNYDYVETISMLSYTNRMFYEKNIIIKGSLILDRDTSEYYILYLDPMVFYESSTLKVNTYH